MKRLLEIIARKAEIRKLLEDPKADLAALEKELRDLNDEKELIEKRQRLLKEAEEINEGKEGTVVGTLITGVVKETKSKLDKYNTEEYRQAFMTYTLTGNVTPELRVDATTKTTDIGAVIPMTIMNEVVQKLTSFGQVYARIRKTSFPGGLKIPTASVKPTATWKTEGNLSDKQKKTISTYIEFSYYKLQCRMATSLEADTVALPVFEATIAADMAEAIVKALETAVIKGSGVGEPKGVTIHTAEIPSAQQITIAAADMSRWDKWKKNVFAQIPLAYEGAGIFLMTKPTFETYIEGMVDAVGQPIARTNYGITGSPIRRFGGYEVLCIEAGDLPNYETASTTDIFAVFVDLSEYILNSNLQMTSKRYFDEVTDEWINKMTLIADGKLRDPNGVLLIKKGA